MCIFYSRILNFVEGAGSAWEEDEKLTEKRIDILHEWK